MFQGSTTGRIAIYYLCLVSMPGHEKNRISGAIQPFIEQGWHALMRSMHHQELIRPGRISIILRPGVPGKEKTGINPPGT